MFLFLSSVTGIIQTSSDQWNRKYTETVGACDWTERPTDVDVTSQPLLIHTGGIICPIMKKIFPQGFISRCFFFLAYPCLLVQKLVTVPRSLKVSSPVSFTTLSTTKSPRSVQQLISFTFKRKHIWAAARSILHIEHIYWTSIPPTLIQLQSC